MCVCVCVVHAHTCNAHISRHMYSKLMYAILQELPKQELQEPIRAFRVSIILSEHYVERNEAAVPPCPLSSIYAAK